MMITKTTSGEDDYNDKIYSNDDKDKINSNDDYQDYIRGTFQAQVKHLRPPS